jgi:hypothetical protein
MMFFFKEKPIEIIAYLPPWVSSIAERYPIHPAKNCYPAWWKNLSSGKFNWDEMQPRNTTKSCPGIINILQTGFIMPLWSDLAIEYNKDKWKYQFSDKQSTLTMHTNDQAAGFYDDHIIFKVDSPWIITSPVKLLYTEPTYLRGSQLPFIQPYGINVTTSKTNAEATNVFLFAKKEEQLTQIIIPASTPLLHIIPLTEKNVNIKCVVLDSDEYLRKRSFQMSNRFVSKGLKNIFNMNKA